MALTETVAIAFTGRLVPASFLEFVAQRAARLDLRVAATGVAADRITVEVTGQPDLIDAFEMACSLGPLDCMVLECERAGQDATTGENGNS